MRKIAKKDNKTMRKNHVDGVRSYRLRKDLFDISYLSRSRGGSCIRPSQEEYIGKRPVIRIAPAHLRRAEELHFEGEKEHIPYRQHASGADLDYEGQPSSLKNPSCSGSTPPHPRGT